MKVTVITPSALKLPKLGYTVKMMKSLILFGVVYTLICIADLVAADMQRGQIQDPEWEINDDQTLQWYPTVQQEHNDHRFKPGRVNLQTNYRESAGVQHIVNLKKLLHEMTTEEKASLKEYYWSKLLDQLSSQDGADSQHSFVRNLLDNNRKKAFLMNLLSKFDKKEKQKFQNYYFKTLINKLSSNKDTQTQEKAN